MTDRWQNTYQLGEEKVSPAHLFASAEEPAAGDARTSGWEMTVEQYKLAPQECCEGKPPSNREHGAFSLSVKQLKGQTPQIKGDTGLFHIRVVAHQSHFVDYSD